MSLAASAGLAQVLWPPGSGAEVYAVLDAARDSRFGMVVGLWGFEHACLYGEAVGPELRSVAPFLVRLEHDRRTTRELLEMVWGTAGAIFAVVPVGTGLRRMSGHFRRLLRVLDEAGNVLLFRYYDPRVLRAFIPTCDAAQRAELFGPVLRYVVEGPDGEAEAFAAEEAA